MRLVDENGEGARGNVLICRGMAVMRGILFDLFRSAHILPSPEIPSIFYARGDAGPLAVSWFGLGVAGEVDKLVDIEAYGAWASDRLI